MVGALMAWHLIVEFLIKDDRFRVAEAEELAGQSPNLVVEGVHYASASQVRHVFSQDFGRSLYLVPLQARREQLLAIDWVQDAAVSKIWPDTLRVAIREREPVAFVRLPHAHRRRDAPGAHRSLRAYFASARGRKVYAAGDRGGARERDGRRAAARG